MVKVPPPRPPAISPANIAQLQQKITYSPHSGTISNVSFSPSGDRLVLACGDHVELFTTLSGNNLGEINVGSAAAHAACFHPNGQMLAICGGNAARLTIWDAASRTLVQEV